MLYADDIFIVDETREYISRRIHNWGNMLERTNFKFMCIKTTQEEIPKCKAFYYLRFRIQMHGKIKKDVDNKIKAESMKWKINIRNNVIKSMPTRLKYKC